jgi:hypothetical protein
MGHNGRFKQLLESQKLLDAWHKHEEKEEEKRLREWCAENGVELVEEGGAAK